MPAGMDQITVTSRNAWHRTRTKDELARPQGTAGDAAVAVVGRAFVDQNIAIRQRKNSRRLDPSPGCDARRRAVMV
jgi:hypothetical protein